MLSHKQIVLAVGAAVMVSALAMVPRDAQAWQFHPFRIPADITERLMPGRRIPVADAAVRRATTVKAGKQSTVSAVRRTSL